MRTLITLTTLTLASTPALAHPGHGTLEASSMWHHLIEHSPPILAAIAGLLLIGGMWRRRQRR
jgi:hypothetical protein